MASQAKNTKTRRRNKKDKLAKNRSKKSRRALLKAKAPKKKV